MPELPEVESIKIQLQKFIVGHKIEDVTINYAKIFIGDKNKVLGSKIKAVRRFAKILVIDFNNQYSIVIQIKMTGQLLYQGPNLDNFNLSKKIIGGLPGKHTHVIFYLDRKGVLYYNDVRKFGKISVVKTLDVKKTGLLGKLGPEPFNGLTIEKFAQAISSSSRPIKILLMDQSKIGGVGNIYANDALWLAKINPKRPSTSLSSSEQTKLYEAILSVLKEGIEKGGASELSFVTPDGLEGEYQKNFLAYGREGELCSRCKKEKFEKFFLGGRGTYFCPACQS